MATRFVDIDRDTALLLPPDLRDWVPASYERGGQNIAQIELEVE